ncbi:MAG TPA: UxaA family hydrolase [Casimicrobiaceae bacterium]|nr:UxaA family hydrolase [Casimicrobiaceae bacterium]
MRAIVAEGKQVSNGAPVAFAGYRRAEDRYGVRNHVLVLGINGLVARTAERIQRSVAGSIVFASSYGRGQYGADKEAHFAQLVGLGRNPNVAATLVVGADRPAAEAVAEAIAAVGKPAGAIALDDVHEDALELSLRGARVAAQLARDASRIRREPAPVSSLFVAVECGHSDATSGVASNPLAGKVVDRIVDAGGTAVFGETIEWLGAEHVLARRAATTGVAAAIVAAVRRREDAVAGVGLDLTGNNPGVENIRGGLSSIEEKSLGAIAKGGSRPIAGVLGVAESPKRAGVYVMDAPGFSPESMTGFAAAGAQVMLFTTGAGNSYCSAVAPTIKISARPDTVARLSTQIDFDASGVFEGRDDPDAAADRLYALLLEVCSGTRTWGELLGESGESIIRIGGSL